MSGTLHVHILLCHLAHLCMFLRILLLLLLLGLGCVHGLGLVQLGFVLGLLLPAFCGLLVLRLVWMHVGVGLLVVFVSGVPGTGGSSHDVVSRPSGGDACAGGTGGFLPVQKSTSYCLGNSWSDTARSQGPTARRCTKGGVSGPAEDLRPVSEVESGVNFRPAGRVRGQVAGLLHLQATRHRYQDSVKGRCGHTFPPPGGSWYPIRVTWMRIGHQAIDGLDEGV